MLNALFVSSRSQVYGLGVALLEQGLQKEVADVSPLATLEELKAIGYLG